MIAHVFDRAREAGLGPVLVAAAEPEIISVIKNAGGEAVLTDPNHASGSDRIYEALEKYDAAGHFDSVINVQGDLPVLDPGVIRRAWDCLHQSKADIATLAAEITRPEEKDNPNVVKVVAALTKNTPVARALYFTRVKAPANEGPYFHHIGLYAYKRDALERFVRMPPGILEFREKLEQLRALEAGMHIDVALVDTVPLGVDTEEDLYRAREMLEKKIP